MHNLVFEKTLKMTTFFRYHIDEISCVSRIMYKISPQEKGMGSYRTELWTRGNKTDHYTQSMIFVFKYVALTRMQAYNLIALFQFITEDLEMYFHHTLLSMAFGKPQNLHLAACCLGENASFVSMSSITMCEKNPYQFQVTNMYMQIPREQGINGNACLHQVEVALKYGISNLNFIPQTAKERYYCNSSC